LDHISHFALTGFRECVELSRRISKLWILGEMVAGRSQIVQATDRILGSSDNLG
jgi:hypothetical protein